MSDRVVLSEADFETALRLKDEGKRWDEIGKVFNLSAEAIRKRCARYERITHDHMQAATGVVSLTGPVIVEGSMPDHLYPDAKYIDGIWQNVISQQSRRLEYVRRIKAAQRIVLPQLPCAVALLSDVHIGDPFADYKSMRSDADTIRETPGMVAGFIGDGINNWVIGKLKDLQRNEAISYDDEWFLFFDWMERFVDKMTFCVTGNHDNWTKKLANVDRIAEQLRGVQTLYHTDQVLFTLEVGNVKKLVKARHKWKGHSKYNDTHGIESDRAFGDDLFDIGIGGHTHAGTIFRDFIRNNRMIIAALLGSYKFYDSHGVELGFRDVFSTGCGAVIIREDGGLHTTRSLEDAADYLKFLQTKTVVVPQLEIAEQVGL